MKTLKNIPSRDRMSQCSQIWAQLSEDEKDLWKTRFNEAVESYTEQLEQFKKVSTSTDIFVAIIFLYVLASFLVFWGFQDYVLCVSNFQIGYAV